MSTATKTRHRSTNGHATAKDVAQSAPTPAGSVTMDAGAVLEAKAALESLAGLRIPYASAMAIRRALRAVTGPAEDIEAEKQKLIKTLAQRDAAGAVDYDRETGRIYFGENHEAYAAGYAELMETQITIPAGPIPASALEIESIEPAILFALGDLLLDDL
ncbi:MAG: hypothetical protein KDE20_06460 [Caldilineaceae bacterium]|nr:hypothetical protein [Caldilineaceae bacterium]